MCSCDGVKLIAIGAVVAANNQGWFWAPLSDWLVVGLMLVVLGVVRMVWPSCPVHDKPIQRQVAAVRKRRR